MAITALSLIFSAIILLILYSQVDIRVLYSDKLIFKIDFFLFTLVLTPGRREGGRRKKLNFSDRLNNGISKTAAIRRALSHLLDRSSLTIHSVSLPDSSGEPSDTALRTAYSSSIVIILLSYLSLKLQQTELEDELFFPDTDPSTPRAVFDLTIQTTLKALLSTYFIYIYYYKRRTKRAERKNVRNKNE